MTDHPVSPPRYDRDANGAVSPPLAAERPLDVAAIQGRTVRLLFLTQVIGGVGLAVGGSVGALLAADLAGVGLSGVAQSANVVGAALFAVPAAHIVERRGRRPSLAAGYALAAVGALLVVAAAMRDSVALLFAGLFLFGCGSAAGYQARYAAVDLATDALRGRHLSLVVWATTLGAVVGPGLAAAALGRYGVPTLAGPSSSRPCSSGSRPSRCSRCCGRTPPWSRETWPARRPRRRAALAGVACARRSLWSCPGRRPGWAWAPWRSGTW
jgi:MFS family permease